MNSSATPAEIHLVEEKLQSLLSAKGIAEITIERELKNEVKKNALSEKPWNKPIVQLSYSRQ